MSKSNFIFLETVEDAFGNVFECYVGIKDERGEIITPKLTSGKHLALLKRIFPFPHIYMDGNGLKILRYTAEA